MPIYSGQWPAHTYRRPDKTVYAQPNSTTGQRLLARRQLKHPSQQQRAVMDAFRLCAWNWQDHLSEEDREQWCEDAAGGPMYVRNGCLVFVNGFAHFVRSQLPQQYSEPSTVDIPGPNYHSWSGIYLAQASWNAGTGQANLQWDNPDNIKNEEDTLLIVHQVNPALPLWAPHLGGSQFNVHDAPASARIIASVSPWPTENNPTLWVTPCYEATPDVDMWFYARWCWHATHWGGVQLAVTAPFPPTGSLTGLLDPDITGTYVEDGEYSGAMSYKHETLNWYICVFPWLPFWHIAEAKDQVGSRGWTKYSGDTAAGTYNPYGTATGTATFTIT